MVLNHSNIDLSVYFCYIYIHFICDVIYGSQKITCWNKFSPIYFI